MLAAGTEAVLSGRVLNRKLITHASPWRAAGMALVFLALTWAVYSPAMRGEFIWDDWTYIVNNAAIRGKAGFWAIWRGLNLTDYWPVSYSAFWLEYAVFGMQPLGYHLVNATIHAGNCWLLWRLAAHLRCAHALFAALLFAVHPVNVEAVAWIFQTKTTLAAFFALAALWCALLAVAPERRRWWWPALAAQLLFALAMLSKAAVVTWPLVIALVSVWRTGSWRLSRRYWAVLAPMLTIAALLGALNLYWYAIPGPEAVSELIRDDGWQGRLAIGGMAFWFYLGKALWPVGLCFVYPRWQWQDQGALAFIPLAALVCTGLVLARWRATRVGLPLFLLFAYLVMTLLPVLGVHDIYFFRYAWVADHWQYLTLMGGCLAVAAATPAGGGRRPWPWIGKTVLVAALAFLAWKRSAVYAGEESLWRDTLQSNPNSWMAHNSLGLVLKHQGHYAEALAHYETAARLKPQAQSYYNIAKIYDEHGDWPLALENYSQAVALNPYMGAIYVNRGVVLAKSGKLEAAMQDFQQALSLGPNALAHYNIGYMLRDSDRAQALAHLEAAVRLEPEVEKYRSTYESLKSEAK